MFSFLDTLSDASIRSAALFGIVALCLPLVLRRSSAARRHLLWVISLLVCIAMPVFSLALPRWEVLPPDTMPAPSQIISRPAIVIIAQALPSASSDDSLAVAEPPSASAAAGPGQPDWQTVIVVAWAVGFGAMLLPIIVSRLFLVPFVRSSRTFTHVRLTPVPVLMSPRCHMPMAFGVVRPRILLPEAAEHWPSERVDAVLAHELAHIGRFDCLWQTLGQLARAMYWFNPLAWHAYRRLLIEAERACDDAVLRKGAASANYAEDLLSIATAGRSDALLAAAAIAMARPTTLEGRMLSILDAARNRQRVTLSIAAAAIVVMAGIVIPLAAVHAQTPSATGNLTAQGQPASTAPSTNPTAKGIEPLPTARELPGTLVFHGRYQHRSGGREIAEPSEVWVNQQADGAAIAMASMPSMQSFEMVVGNARHQPIAYRSRAAARGGRPEYGMDMEIQDGKVKLTRRGIRENVDGRVLTVPPGAIFDPNSRPDSYCAANILLRQMQQRKAGLELHAYDWDNTGEELADYTIRIEFRGSEKVQVPAGTFEANHFVLTQTSTANTWFKKRAGHTTDFWLLDSGVIVRIVRQREPYEMVLLDYDVPKADQASATIARKAAPVDAAASAGVPVVVTVTPASMQENVNPATTELRVVFDQPMDTGGFSWVGGGPAYPQTTGQARWIDDRTCVLPVKLEGGRDYWFSINNSRFTGFRSKGGVAVRPHPVWFQTSASGSRKASGPPKVQKAEPPSGAANVDPKLTEIRVTFDQPMEPGGFSWVTVDEHFPKTTGKAHWIDDRTCALPVKLEPGREYSLSLNATSFLGFCGKSGVPSIPYPLSFHTSGEATTAPPPKATTAADRAHADELAKEGWTLWNKGDFAAATDRFQEAVTLNPTAANTWNGLGWSLFNSGQRDEAKEAFSRCVALSPKHPAALNGLGQIALLEGDFPTAEKQLLAASPTASAAWWGLAKLYLVQEKFDDSLKWINRILKQDANNADALQLKKAAEAKQVPAELKRQIAPK